MTESKELREVLGDYGRFVRALIPQSLGMLCHDERADLLWHDEYSPAIQLTADFNEAIRTRLKTPASPGLAATITVPGATAHIMRLSGQRGRGIGTVTVLLPAGLDEAATASCHELLLPAIRTLRRDLVLRLRLIEAQQRLGIQIAEEKLLHDVEEAVHERRGCESVLRHILSLCQTHLGVDGLALMLPDKRIRLVLGDAISLRDAEQIIEVLPAAVEDSGVLPGPPSLLAARADLLCLPLLQGGRRVTGVLAMAGWDHSGFSERRRIRVAKFIASHIEFVLNRDFDPLTGLMAWSLFERELVAARQNKDPELGDCTILYLDIDQVHVINETLGRDAGDEIFVRFAALVRDNLAGHLVTRIASNSFAALLKGVTADAAMLKAQAICDGFRELVYCRGTQTYRPSVSIGVGPLGTEEEGGSGALATAQVACRAAKDRGRGRVELYETGDESIVRRLDDIQLVGFVRSAIENNRLTLMAQPIKSLRPGVTVQYYEVLVRMLGTHGQHISPSEFLSSAERYQMMEEIDRWVVSRTLGLIAAQAERLQAAEMRFAINLSGQSLGSEQFLPFVSAELQRTGVPPGMICFEITESVAVTRMQQAQTFMHTLQRAGCSFSLDDFGTGLASFAYLKLFPVNTLKIDGSFIRDVVTNVVSQSMVAAISEVARVMNLDTVAEFVQDDEALRLLRDLGISWAQGYLLGVPQPLEELLNATAAVPRALVAVSP